MLQPLQHRIEVMHPFPAQSHVGFLAEKEGGAFPYFSLILSVTRDTVAFVPLATEVFSQDII